MIKSCWFLIALLAVFPSLALAQSAAFESMAKALESSDDGCSYAADECVPVSYYVECHDNGGWVDREFPADVVPLKICRAIARIREGNCSVPYLFIGKRFFDTALIEKTWCSKTN